MDYDQREGHSIVYNSPVSQLFNRCRIFTQIEFGSNKNDRCGRRMVRDFGVPLRTGVGVNDILLQTRKDVPLS